MRLFNVEFRFAPPGPKEDGDEVWRYRSDRPTQPALHSQLPPRLDLRFGDPSVFGSPSISGKELADIFNHVVEVVAHFDRDFPMPVFK
jgi:hypothetical protein